MLSYRAWQQQYNSDPSVVGSTFIVEGHPFTIAGIAPPGFFGETLRSNPPELWLPLQQEPLVNAENSLLKQSISAWLRVIGRLKPGASMDGVAPRLTGIMRQWMPHDSGWPAEFMPLIVKSLPKQQIRIVPGGAGVGAMKADYGDSLRILLTVCCLVLLIACANIANLLLARGAARRSQTSVRLALGASRRRLIRQSFTESVVLSVLGGVAGVVVAYLGVKLIVALAFHSAHYVPIDATPSLPVLAFAFGLSLLTGVLFGTAPAWFTSHGNPAEALRGANRSTRDSATLPQKILVVVQATLSIVLLAGAGLLTRSLRNLEHQSFGFETDHRISIVMNGPPASLHRASARRALPRVAGPPCCASPEWNAQRSPSIPPTSTTGANWSFPKVMACRNWMTIPMLPGIASAPVIWKPWASRFCAAAASPKRTLAPRAMSPW